MGTVWFKATIHINVECIKVLVSAVKTKKVLVFRLVLFE